MFDKLIVVDGKGHLVGRLASILAKELMNGQHVVVVRCEKLILSGSLFRNKVKFGEFLNHTSTHNPKRFTQHQRSPARLFWRAIRGMISRKTKRGTAALQRLKVFEGIPAPYDTKKRQCVPQALKVIRLQNCRDYCYIGQLCDQVGWKKQNLVDQLEARRKIRSKTFYEQKLKKINRKRQAENLPEVQAIKKQLEKYGY